MAQTTRQSSLLVNQNWTKIYQSFTNADFSSYDFETLRNSMINYLKTYYPESFNDFLESSEYLALIDMIAFLGQSLAFRTDLNARENFMDTAQRRDSILKLARMLSYNPRRNTAAQGILKFDSVRTTESVYDSNGINLANQTVNWNDTTNDNWLEQFTAIINASLISTQQIGKPGHSQVINNVQTDEYAIALNPNSLPVAPFTIRVGGVQTNFEAVSASSIGQSYVYEVDPTIGGKFNVLYQNDNNGNGSNNTGFFLFFKQGSLSSTTFNITNAVPNNTVSINTNNITNIDQWLYHLDVNGNPATLWQQVPAIVGVNVIFNNITNKNLYQVNSLLNDQIALVFGDGSFANVPQGQFRFYYRTANGQTYSVGPDDIASVSIGFSYISKKNTLETLTVTASLKYTVTNAAAAPSINDIKTLAPQQFYTQNRMVNGEDYNIFPLTSFSSIQKVHAINRTSSGISLYLDAIDPTGTFSSTNIFGDDGILATNNTVLSTSFSFLTTNDIYSALYNNIIPILSSVEVENYYYSQYPRYNSTHANVLFNQVTSSTSSSTGYLQWIGNTQPIGAGVAGNLRYVDTGASLHFTAPNGQYFDAQHVLHSGTPNTIIGDTSSFYATVTSVTSNSDPYTPSLITLGTVVPTGAVLSDTGLAGNAAIIPPYKTGLSSSLVSTVVGQIQAKVNFGLYFDQVNQVWTNILPSQIGASTNWLMKFTYLNGIYNVQYKVVEYLFSSAAETNFYFDPTTTVYDSTAGQAITDTIKILKINNQSNSAAQLGIDVPWQIYKTVTGSDGYVVQNQVMVTFPSTQLPGVPDNPDLYLTVNGNLTTRSGLYFQYKHNAASRNRIDPTPINIIDLYVLTSSYASSYLAWLRDLTGTIVEPTLPTSTELESQYSTLNGYKVVSDTVVFNPARFKPLFGAKADPSLQAKFKVVINPSSGISPNEMATQIIAAMNTYFDPSNWGFGDTFYFSELSAYLHQRLAPNLSSIVIVPSNSSLVFGNYFQINSDPWEIITSAATVNDIEVVTAITAATLNLGNPLTGTY
ncbi:MAG TPA: hypothetical protein VFM18_19070 [Methanosarcina sp.]|nr:hypothetical protein [Methanosarcina sp.]